MKRTILSILLVAPLAIAINTSAESTSSTNPKTKWQGSSPVSPDYKDKRYHDHKMGRAHFKDHKKKKDYDHKNHDHKSGKLNGHHKEHYKGPKSNYYKNKQGNKRGYSKNNYSNMTPEEARKLAERIENSNKPPEKKRILLERLKEKYKDI